MADKRAPAPASPTSSDGAVQERGTGLMTD